MLWCYRVCVPQYRAVGITRVAVGVSGRDDRSRRSGRSMGGDRTSPVLRVPLHAGTVLPQLFSQVSMSASHRIYHILHTDNIQTHSFQYLYSVSTRSTLGFPSAIRRLIQ